MSHNFNIKNQSRPTHKAECFTQNLIGNKTITLLKTLLTESIIKCYSNDFLLIKNCMEQASVARIFYYMQNAIINDKRFTSFRHLHLDCEYFKNIDEPKITDSKPNGTRPDLILHQRKNNKNNFLIVEFKTHKNNRYSSDFEKLKNFTSINGAYNYKLGVFVRLKYDEPSYTYFIEGQVHPQNDSTT